jgi:hypothetical protein
MKDCNRCGQMQTVSDIGSMLVHFVCDTCRLDNNSFHTGHDSSVAAMNRQLVETGDFWKGDKRVQFVVPSND